MRVLNLGIPDPDYGPWDRECWEADYGPGNRKRMEDLQKKEFRTLPYTYLMIGSRLSLYLFCLFDFVMWNPCILFDFLSMMK